MTIRTPSPSEVSDDEWAFVAAYLTSSPIDVDQRHNEKMCYDLPMLVHNHTKEDST